MTKINLTPDELKVIGVLIRKTWEYVGPEFEELCGGHCSKAEQCEAVLDAGRLEIFFAKTEGEKRNTEKVQNVGL